MGKSATRIHLLRTFPGCLVPRPAADVVYDDAMPAAHEFRNPDRNGSLRTLSDFVQQMGSYTAHAMGSTPTPTVVFAIDNPAHVPLAKEPEQHERDAARVATASEEHMPEFKWLSPMPPSDVLFGNRRIKRHAMQLAADLIHNAVRPHPGKRLVVTGHRFGAVEHAPFKPPRKLRGMPKCGEAELRWVGMALHRDEDGQLAFPGTWLVHTIDTDGVIIALMHAAELLEEHEVFIDYGGKEHVIDLRKLMVLIRKFFVERGSRWDGEQLGVGMQMAGNDFMRGWPQVSHGSIWSAICAHSAHIGRIVHTDTHTRTYELKPRALERMMKCAYYCRWKLTRTLPLVGDCSWEQVRAAVRATGKEVPDDTTIHAHCERFLWTLNYWGLGCFDKRLIPSANRGWRRNASGHVVRR